MFVSCDDKAKIDFGEPGALISSGVRGKKVLFPQHWEHSITMGTKKVALFHQLP